MSLLSGKAEIVYLLSKVIEKYEQENGVVITKNSNRKNYDPIARLLSHISNQLPYSADDLEHDSYPIDYNPKAVEYPFRKYDLTGNQIKDAYFNRIVANPRPFLVDACYIYLYGKGRKGFAKNPTDENLLFTNEHSLSRNQGSENPELPLLHPPPSRPLDKGVLWTKESSEPYFDKKTEWLTKSNRLLTAFSIGLASLSLVFLYKWRTAENIWRDIKSDMKIMPYQATQAEIDSLEGIWLSYIGSPQARISDPYRYHLVVQNVVEIKYKNGYFILNRYGANFDHEGYAQFESPWLVSIFTYVRNKYNQIESPRHSLMRLNKEKPFLSVISASWNFDSGKNNDVIGIREVYVKQGKGGQIEEVLNTLENASCKCKIIKWLKDDDTIAEFRLKNQLLDSLPEANLRHLLNENSILLRIPMPDLLLRDSSRR